MKKILLVILLAISSSVIAQPTSQMLVCFWPATVANLNGITFNAKFNGKTADITFKGWTYTVSYTNSRVGSDGVRQVIYSNEEIIVIASPLDNFVVVFNTKGEHISSGRCR